MVEGDEELKLDMGVLQGGLVGPWHCMSPAQQYTSHWEGQWESGEEGGMRMRNGDGILNSTLVLTEVVFAYCSQGLWAAGATPTCEVKKNAACVLCMWISLTKYFQESVQSLTSIL